MTGRSRLNLFAGLGVALPLCALLIVGCQNQPDTSQGPGPGVTTSGPGAPPGMQRGPGGPPGMGGPGGGRGGPVAENASGEEIMQAKCGCHGPGGSGGRAPKLSG